MFDQINAALVSRKVFFWMVVYRLLLMLKVSTYRLFHVFLCCFVCSCLSIFVFGCVQNVNGSEVIQDELNEKVDRLKAELVVFKSLMSDVSISMSRDQNTTETWDIFFRDSRNLFVFIVKISMIVLFYYIMRSQHKNVFSVQETQYLLDDVFTTFDKKRF